MRKEFKNKNGETVILEKIDGKWVKLEEGNSPQLSRLLEIVDLLKKYDNQSNYKSAVNILWDIINSGLGDSIKVHSKMAEFKKEMIKIGKK
jgi:hypothetical protein